MKLTLLTISILSLGRICLCLPRTKNEAPLKSNAAGLTSQIIATNLLKDNIDGTGNHVFSPLGISSMLAILAEGARGNTYNEFMSALSFPEDKMKLRESFKEVLSSLYQKSLKKNPSFRTWFYVYRNNTARDEYKQILRDYYLVDVKDIDANYDQRDLQSTTMKAVTSTTANSKDISEFEDLKKSQSLVDTPNEPVENKDASKFDKVIEDKQYVEVPVIREEIVMEVMSESDKKEDRKPIEKDTESVQDKDNSTPMLNTEENETIKEDEKVEALRKNVESVEPIEVKESNEPEKITIPLKKLEDFEIMQALESHFVKKRVGDARSLFQKDDVASALSANAIIDKGSPSKTKMLLFNGLYYRGNWAYPFQELRSGDDDLFYITKETSIPVTMMRTRGLYRTADIKEIESQVIELPYEDKRYSFYAVVPNERDGLKDLIKKMKPEFYSTVMDQLKENFISLCLPKFCTEETTRSEATLQRLGLKTLFTPIADLSGISEDMDLHVEGVVQHVNVKVDEGAMAENVLTAAAQSRSAPDEEEEKKIIVDRPFLYFVVDKETEFVIIAGKIMQPKTDDKYFLTNQKLN